MTIHPKLFESSQGPHGHVNKAKTAIEIYHLISKSTIKFIPFITNFSDDHTSTWSEEQVYGRMDDLLSFQRTRRTIQLAFDVPSVSEQEAITNFKSVSLFKQFMYPSYAQRTNALSIKGAPLFRVKLLNFINSLKEDGSGLLCKISSVSFSPNQEAGFYLLNQAAGGNPANINNVIVPKLFSLSFEMNVLHEYTPGWVEGDFQKSLYPYNMQSPLSPVEQKGSTAGVATNKNDRPIDIAQTNKVLTGKS
jgi:hypothetical protein